MIIPSPIASGKNYDTFSPEQIATLREGFAKFETMNPDKLPQLHAIFEPMTDTALVNLARAGIKFISNLAFNAAMRRGIAPDEIRGESLAEKFSAGWAKSIAAGSVRENGGNK